MGDLPMAPFRHFSRCAPQRLPTPTPQLRVRHNPPRPPEQDARQEIDRLLTAAGWHVCSFKQADIHAARGVAIREFPLDAGHGDADYLFYIDGKAAGVIEAKRQGATLTGVETRLDEEWGRDREGAQTITSRSTTSEPDELITSVRATCRLRTAVTHARPD